MLNAWKSKSMLRPEDVVHEIVQQLSAGANVRGPITADSRIAEDLNMDSLAIMNFIMTLEDRYDIALPIDKLAKIRTIGGLAELVVELSNGQSAA